MVRRCTGFLTASVIGPLGKVLGFMHNRDYVEVPNPEIKASLKNITGSAEPRTPVALW
jgi:hypothetical protein